VQVIQLLKKLSTKQPLAYFCCMKRSEIIEHLTLLGQLMHQLGQSNPPDVEKFSQKIILEIEETVQTEIYKNGWFNTSNVRNSLAGISAWLTLDQLQDFTRDQPFYRFEKQVSLILAGNLPLVGFHDVLCCLLMGCKMHIKMSSDDQRLLPVLLKALVELNPSYLDYIELNPIKLAGHHAVIGTGSDSSLLHFQSYFKDVPHLLRGNRTSIAVIDGTETHQELEALGKDIFDYFGRGCRSVTHLMVPETYSLDRIFSAILSYDEVLQNKKYGNNYEYHRAVFLLSQQSLLDNGFLLLKETKELQAPIAMLYFHRYVNPSEIDAYLALHHDQIQCILGKGFLPFGTAQRPRIHDFADQVNTLEWLSKALN
jgi:hypothetical protein